MKEEYENRKDKMEVGQERERNVRKSCQEKTEKSSD